MLKAMSSKKWVRSCLTVTLFVLITIAPTASGLSSVDQRGGRKLFGGYRITPKFCRATKSLPRSDPRSRGPTICMFNHECAQRQGEVVGACMDGFLFGACCQIPGELGPTLIQQVQQSHPLPSNFAAAQSYEKYGGTHQNDNSGYQPVPVKQASTYPTAASNTGSGYYDANGSDLESEANIESNYNSEGNNVAESEDHKTNNVYGNTGPSFESTSAANHYDDEVSSYLPDATASPYPTTPGQMYLPINFSSELPSHITSSPYDDSHENYAHPSSEKSPVQGIFTSEAVNHLTHTIVHEDPTNGHNEEFTQSGITHPGVETVLLDDDLQFSTGYGPSTVYVPAPPEVTSTPMPSVKPTYKKPVFRPKPTTSSTTTTLSAQGSTSDEKYVLVQTLSSDDKRPISPSGMTTSDIESIESIILMLNNNTQQVPQYDSQTASTEMYRPIFNSPFKPIKTTPRPTSTPNLVTKDKYSTIGLYGSSTPSPTTIGSSQSLSVADHLYPSTKVPSSTLRPPFTPISTTKLRPSPTTASTTQRPTTILVTKKVTKITTTRRPATNSGTPPQKKLPPSTSYVTGPPTPRPELTSTYGGSSTAVYLDDIKFASTTPSSVPSSTYGSTQHSPSSSQYIEPTAQTPTYVKIDATQKPEPTVIITPKPTVNLITSSTWMQRPSSQYTTVAPPALPSTSYIFNPIVTQRPGFVSSTEEYIHLPPLINNDFDDPGYYGQSSTVKPAFDKLATLAPGDTRPSYPGYYGPTPSYGGGSLPTPSVFADHYEEEVYTSPNDFVNFPPVRNPNLNASATTSSVTNDFDISTPAFVEDDALRDKMNLLVSKIVASLQNNFDNLAEMVDERNASSDAVQTTLQATKRPATTVITTKKVPSTKPPTRRPGTQTGGSRPTTLNRPGGQTSQTITRPSSAATKPTPPNRKPATTKKPPVRKTTSKPTTTPTKKTTVKPTGTRRPVTKPTRRPTTTLAPQQDEVDEEEGANEEDNTIPQEEIAEGIEDSEEGSKKFQCGVRPMIKSGRIVGGKGARFGEWPWQVLVRESTWLGLFTKNKCGGVLVTNRFVITAAHCQPGFLASLVAVFGEFDISGDLEVKRSVTKNVKEVIVHRGYDAATFENDLALLKLESPVHYDTHIIPVCMPPDNADFTGRMATVTGWGRLRYGGGVPSILQVVQVPVIENSVCQEMFNTAKHKKKILPSFLCAGYANGQKDSCEGDSGGPLVMQRDDGRWQLVGTVSHGVKCADPYLPGVYMRTTYYKPWLKSITGVK